MSKVIFGNHSSVLVPRIQRDHIRKFYCDVLGGQVTKADPDRDFIRLGENFFIAFLYGEVPDESEFLRSARSIWLEIKSDQVEELRKEITSSGLVKELTIPDPHLYFQAPGGQCMRLVGIQEDLSFYEGTGDGPDMAKIKEALAKNESYQITIEVSAGPMQVFDRINEVPGWFKDKGIKGRSTRLHDEFIFNYGEGDHAHYSKQQLTELIPGKKIVWLITESKINWITKDKEEWTGTKVVFEISTAGNKTVLHFTHVGMIPGLECYSNCKLGWDMIIGDWLFNYINKKTN